MFFTIIGLSVLFVSGFAHEGMAQRVMLNHTRATLQKIISEISEQTGYNVVMNETLLKGHDPMTVQLHNATLEEALSTVLEGKHLVYRVDNDLKLVVIGAQPKRPDGTTAKESPETLILVYTEVRGRVVDSLGNPLQGASIRVKGYQLSTKTDREGNFILRNVPDDALLEISFIGYVSREIKAASDVGVIRLLEVPAVLQEVQVVATGMTTRDKETFTGAASVFSGQELKAVGNVNVIQSLRSLDPSFLVLENNSAGSDPNVLPSIEVRGQTSITTESLQDEFWEDPNQPLFILDGFETTLQTIVDLDMNRVSSITILKDAASMAIYGSRASNGVIVVETIQPVAGEIKLQYVTDISIESPDLSGYNMMNAAEKLEFERLSGVYTAPANQPELQNSYYNPIYSERLQKVVSGVNSYWLSDPLQTGFSQRHSLYAEGGAQALTFNAGGNYRTLRGMMIGSERKDWGARLNLSYRSRKLRVNNNAYISGYRSDESNYGDFSTWVNTNPYYEKADASEPYLFNFYDSSSSSYYTSTTTSYIRVSNPLYNASLNSSDYTSSYTITNNLQVLYDLTSRFRIQGSVQVNKTATETNTFKSPLHTDFEDTEQLKKGTYHYRHISGFSYTANAMASYAQYNGKHAFQANLRAEIQDKTNRLKGFAAEGFPTSTNGNPRFAYGYQENGSPTANSSIARRNSLIANGYYSYDERYNVDFSLTYDGSTSFGNENLYEPFASLGASWNLHNERFFRSVDWINSLRLRASYGVTGNQNFTSATSVSTYTYLADYNYMGQGVDLTTLGNPNLKWQNTYQTNLGLDASLLDNRFSVQLNAYRKYTDPLVIAIDLPSSTSLDNYPINAGNLTVKGIEGNIRFAPIYKPQERVVWFIELTGTTLSQKYNGFNNILSGLNETLRSLNSLTRYRDGYDYYDLWAVPSLGIDPATGQEIFLKKDGSQTFTYSYEDQVKVGNERPDIQGVISNMLSYKGLTMSVYLRYIVNRDIWNEALFNKVENISLSKIISSNQDKRALYERWQQPGDIAQFKAISLTGATNMSSRFVQREDVLTVESVSLGYEVKNKQWLDNLRLSNLRITGYTNDLFYWSTVRRERGTSYPYARSFSFSLVANIK